MSLDAAIELHRNLYKDELYLEWLTSTQPPTSLNLLTRGVS